MDHDPEHKQEQSDFTDEKKENLDPGMPDLNKPKKNIFSRFKERVSEMAESVKIRVRMSGPQQLAEKFVEFKYRDHEHRVNYLENEKRIFSARIADLKDRLSKIDASAESVITNIGDLPVGIRQKFDNEKKLLQDALQKNRELLEDVDQQLSVQQDKTDQYDKKFEKLTEKTEKSISEVLANPEARLNHLKDLHKQAVVEANNFETRIAETEEALGYMPLVWDGAPSRTEQDVYAAQIKELRDLLKFYKKQLDQRRNTAEQTAEQTRVLEKRLKYLQDKKEGYAKLAEKGFTPREFEKEPELIGEYVEDKNKSEAERQKSLEEYLRRARYPIDRIIEAWNSLYMTKLMILPNEFKNSMTEQDRSSANKIGIDFHDFMDILKVYAKKKKIKFDFDLREFMADVQKLPRMKNEPKRKGEPQLLAADASESESSELPDYESPLIDVGSSTELKQEFGNSSLEGKETPESDKNKRYERSVILFEKAWNEYFSDQFHLNAAEFNDEAAKQFSPEKYKELNLRQLFAVAQSLFIKNRFKAKYSEIIHDPVKKEKYKQNIANFRIFFTEKTKGRTRIDKFFDGDKSNDKRLSKEWQDLYEKKFELGALCSLWNEIGDFIVSPKILSKFEKEFAGYTDESNVSIGEFLDVVEQYKNQQKPKSTGKSSGYSFEIDQLMFEGLVKYNTENNNDRTRS